MTTKEPPSAARLHELLRYEPETGRLFWKPRADTEFKLPRDARAWNAKNAGKEAGKKDARGYRHVSINKKLFYAHRIIWAMTYGEWPTLDIDHIDQDRTNNRIGNLREIPHQENTMNSRMHWDNTSGYTGVRQVESGNWQASIFVRGQRSYLGTFDNLQAAVEARKKAQDDLGFSPIHGRPRT